MDGSIPSSSSFTHISNTSQICISCQILIHSPKEFVSLIDKNFQFSNKIHICCRKKFGTSASEVINLLKDRKGHKPSYVDITHYQSIIKVLDETSMVMKEL